MPAGIDGFTCAFGLHNGVGPTVITEEHIVDKTLAIGQMEFRFEVATRLAETGFGQGGVDKIPTCLGLTNGKVAAGVYAAGVGSNVGPKLRELGFQLVAGPGEFFGLPLEGGDLVKARLAFLPPGFFPLGE